MHPSNFCARLNNPLSKRSVSSGLTQRKTRAASFIVTGSFMTIFWIRAKYAFRTGRCSGQDGRYQGAYWQQKTPDHIVARQNSTTQNKNQGRLKNSELFTQPLIKCGRVPTQIISGYLFQGNLKSFRPLCRLTQSAHGAAKARAAHDNRWLRTPNALKRALKRAPYSGTPPDRYTSYTCRPDNHVGFLGIRERSGTNRIGFD